MVKKTLILLAVFALCSTALEARDLARSEILEVFTALTQAPVKSWIPAGTINATRAEYRAAQTTDANQIDASIAEEVQAYQDNPNKIQLTDKLQAMKLDAIPFDVRYKLSNEYTMNSNVVIKVDGDKFYWQINVGSRTDSVKEPASLSGNYLTEEFDMGCNEERIFAWDGQKYITYFKPVNHAIITKNPSGVNGPLTAGVIPWGYARYSYANLSAADISTGTETQVDGKTQIQLMVVKDGRQETFILDPAKGHALLRYSAYLPDNTSILQVYDDYQLVGDRWVAKSILIERYDGNQNPQKLMARDVWDITSVNGQAPTSTDFEVSYELDAYIEDFCFGDEPLQYRYSAPLPPAISKVDTAELLAQRLMIASSDGKQNCATAALKYTCDKLDVSLSDKDMSKLVHGKNNSTTLLQMQQFAKSIGLEATAVKIDLKTLSALQSIYVVPERAHKPYLPLLKASLSKNLPTEHLSVRLGLARNDMAKYQVIVHLPRQNHFVVLGDMDSQYVRLIDLSSNRFYYRQSIERFNSDWDGTALLVSKESVTPQGSFTKLDENKLEKMIGASTCEQCNNPCSSSGVFPCDGSPPFCGLYTIYFSRSCCGSATSGSCSESSLIYESTDGCGTDPDEGGCVNDGDWKSYTMSACG